MSTLKSVFNPDVPRKPANLCAGGEDEDKYEEKDSFSIFPSSFVCIELSPIVMREINLFEALNQFNTILLESRLKHFTLLTPAGSLYPPLNKTFKKGNCDFLSHNSDFLLQF